MIRFFTFIGGFYFFLEFLLPKEFFGFSFAPYHQSITNGVLTVGVMAIGLGLISILRVHGGRLVIGGQGRMPSLLLLLAMVLMMGITTREALLDAADARVAERGVMLREFGELITRDDKTATHPIARQERVRLLVEESSRFAEEIAALQGAQGIQVPASVRADLTAANDILRNAVLDLKTTLPGSEKSDVQPLTTALAPAVSTLRAFQSAVREQSFNRAVYTFLFQGLWVALSAAMFSLLGFYIASAAFRAFRIRSLESALMMVSSVIVMLGQIPFGVWISESLPALRSWLLSVPSSAAFRAIRIGAGVAGLLMAIRMWLSLDTARSSRSSSGSGRSS